MTRRKRTPEQKLRAREQRDTNCYEWEITPYEPSSSHDSDSRDSMKSVPPQKTIDCPDLSLFSTIPYELQIKIWELAVAEPRIVAIRSTAVGVYAPIPPLLHTCSLSRYIALKHHSLILGSTGSLDYENVPNERPKYLARLEPRIYFNFSKDILYFGKAWNRGVDGQYACFNQLKRLLNKDDVERIEKMAFDVEITICYPRSSSKHGILLGPWKGVKNVYLEIFDDTVAPPLLTGHSALNLGSELDFRKLGFSDLRGLAEERSEEEGRFKMLYRSNVPIQKIFAEGLSVHEALAQERLAMDEALAEGVDGGAYPLLGEICIENCAAGEIWYVE